MRTSRLLSVLAISAGLAGGTAFLTSAHSQGVKPEISYEQTDLNINQVLVKLMVAGYDKVDKIERERNAYEVKAIDRNGARVKLYVDPRTGDLIRPGRQGGKQERHGKDGAPA